MEGEWQVDQEELGHETRRSHREVSHVLQVKQVLPLYCFFYFWLEENHNPLSGSTVIFILSSVNGMFSH